MKIIQALLALSIGQLLSICEGRNVAALQRRAGDQPGAPDIEEVHVEGQPDRPIADQVEGRPEQPPAAAPIVEREGEQDRLNEAVPATVWKIWPQGVAFKAESPFQPETISFEYGGAWRNFVADASPDDKIIDIPSDYSLTSAIDRCATKTTAEAYRSFNLVKYPSQYICKMKKFDIAQVTVRDVAAAISIVYRFGTVGPSDRHIMVEGDLKQQNGLSNQLYVAKVGGDRNNLGKFSSKLQLVYDGSGMVASTNFWHKKTGARRLPSYLSFEQALQKCADYTINNQPFLVNQFCAPVRFGHYLVGRSAQSFNLVQRQSGFECVTYDADYEITYSSQISTRDPTAIRSVAYYVEEPIVKTREHFLGYPVNINQAVAPQDVEVKDALERGASKYKLVDESRGVTVEPHYVRSRKPRYLNKDRSVLDAVNSCATLVSFAPDYKGFSLSLQEDRWVCQVLERTVNPKRNFIQDNTVEVQYLYSKTQKPAIARKQEECSIM